MTAELTEQDLAWRQRDQLLRLVTKGFYKELTNFGVEPNEIVRVASHLLDNMMSGMDGADNTIASYNSVFDLDAVRDDWDMSRTISVQAVSIRSLQPGTVPSVTRWLGDREVRDSFVPPFPAAPEVLSERLFKDTSRYFEVVYADQPVGIVGGENLEERDGKVEMKKLVGEGGMQGKGIGKRATFAFLYYAFKILGLNKVYVHSRDLNMRNINLNSRFGFEIEGILHDDVMLDGKRCDVVRMALLRESWLRLFSPGRSP
jgi:RimJ/RimL family protein N-acetyltransferase